MGKQVRSAKELEVYRLAMDIFFVSRGFPKDERFALMGQIRRSSRSVCANLREASAKRRYEAHFISKLTDADENSETDTWNDFASDCGYLTSSETETLRAGCRSVVRMLGTMLKAPSSWILAKIMNATVLHDQFDH